MRKSQIQIKSPASSPLVTLDHLVCSDTFVNNYKELHIVVTPTNERVNGLIQCLKLEPGNKGVVTFCREALVQPVDIKLEWSYYGPERD